MKGVWDEATVEAAGREGIRHPRQREEVAWPVL